MLFIGSQAMAQGGPSVTVVQHAASGHHHEPNGTAVDR
jgi:hypothetical protein